MVYLIHFDKPISDKHTCQHYLGYSEDEDARIERHKAGNGARLTQVANERNIDYQIVRTWEGDRKIEKKLKALKNSPRLCPICNSRKG